jgi:hypothetical protein
MSGMSADVEKMIFKEYGVSILNLRFTFFKICVGYYVLWWIYASNYLQLMTLVLILWNRDTLMIYEYRYTLKSKGQQNMK